MTNVRLDSIVALSDAIDVPIFVLEVEPDETIRFRKLNRFHEQATGLKSSSVLGKTPQDILPPRMAESVIARYLKCVRSQEPFSYEEVLDFPTGETWWQTTLSPLMDDDQVFGIVGMAIDITARKVQEIRDTQAISELKMLNDEVNMYSSMAAHDVRGPLRKIKIISELVVADINAAPGDQIDPTSPQADLIASIGDISSKALDHVDGILSYARALSLEEKPKLEIINLGHLLRDLVGLVDADERFVFEYKNPDILAERIILQIVLRNLLENAVKYGRGACHIDVQTSKGEPDQIQLVISDDGRGFLDGAVLSEQSAQSRLKSPTHGFGLASAQRMIEQRGGEMWLAPSHFSGGGASVAFSMSGQIVS